MIIDSHCHAGHGDGLTGPWDTHARLDDYLRRAVRAGITHSVLIPVFTSDYRLVNAEVGRMASADPNRFSAYAMVGATRDKGRVSALVSEALRAWGVCGIKVHRYDGRINREICAVAQAFGLPILYDVYGEPSAIDLLASEFPSVPFIIPHLGSFADDWKVQRIVIDAVVRHPNIYTDTSGIRRFDLLVETVRRAGPHKVLFGTDGPWLHPGLELAKVRALGLSADAERLILAGNWLRLTAEAREPARTRGTLVAV